MPRKFTLTPKISRVCPPKIDTASLEQLQRVVGEIPPQQSPRAEAGRINLQHAVARITKENEQE